MNRITIGIFAVSATLALATPALASHSWGNYHWARTASPFTLKLGDNVSSAWDPYLRTASSDWSWSPVLDTTIVTGGGGRNCRATLGRVEVCNSKYGSNGWLGLAQIWITGGTHIAQGVVKVNDSYFNTAKYNNPNERLHVMCQEIGHTFGLGHTSENGSSQDTCMDYFSNTGVNATSASSTKPNPHDYDMLGIIYSHFNSGTPFDSSTTIRATALSQGNRADVNTDNLSGWGKEIRKDSRGHGSLYERDLGGGNKVFTFITWVE